MLKNGYIYKFIKAEEKKKFPYKFKPSVQQRVPPVN